MTSQQVSNESSSSDLKHPEVVEPQAIVVHAPIVLSFNDMIRPLLDCVDKLRHLNTIQEDIKLPSKFKLGHLNIMQDGIQLPTIVVIGDQSSGKSSVLESLVGISLPRGEGICTRVPLIIKLQNHSETEVYLEYNEKSVPTDEFNVAEAITLATNEIAGHGKGISNIPLTLIVKKNGVPDLTMVDLPGIPTVPVHGKSTDTFEQISEIFMKYITPEESIIVNVLSATVDFSTCECFKMSKKVDKTGERTLIVVTKVDIAPEGLLEKVTTNDMNVGLGYVCVKNRIVNETYEEALSEEASLFETHALLSKMDKSMVSIPVLAHKLVQIQANIISKCFLDIEKNINDKLAVNVAALNELPQHSGSVAEALATFMRIQSLAIESLKKIFLGVESNEYTEDFEKQCADKWSKLIDLEFKQFSAKLSSTYPDEKVDNLFMEFMFLDEAQKTGSPDFLDVLKKKVREISVTTEEFVGKLWNYIEGVVIKALMHHSDSSLELQHFIKRAVQNFIARRKDKSVNGIREIIGMDRLTDITSSTDYVATYRSLIAQKRNFVKYCQYSKGSKINIDGFGVIDVWFIRRQPKDLVQQAFELKMTMAAYWKTVFSPQKLDDNEIEVEIVNDRMATLHVRSFAYWKFTLGLEKFVDEINDEVVGDLIASHGGGHESSLQESLSAEMCFRLKKSVKLLQELKEMVAKIMEYSLGSSC
ncbi:dynamin-related protein 4C-like [Solanum pennellii]|uniref:Dynamin-related protein 4C-like n=1 Tax=Solanum pennellii TaxID=28526 RepID=A0ABM1FJB9_SOLPN|nr:dynamin-related protein 4C-like [Solanum pennellii]